MKMNSFVVSIFTYLAALNCCFASFNCENRPSSWKNSINTMFLGQCTQFHQFSTCSGAHLAHVLSWKALCDKSEEFYDRKDFKFLKDFVDYLFEIDSNAKVWIGGASRNYAAKTAISHKDYMGIPLSDLNVKFYNDSSEIVNNWANGVDKNDGKIREFLQLLNSAPANLRYGTGTENVSIGKLLDAMGDGNQQMTKKEKRWLDIIHGDSICREVEAGKTCAKCRSCNEACKSSSASIDSNNFYVCK